MSGDEEKFCDTPLWNVTLTWFQDWPQFTPCFQDTILTFVPCGWLWIATPFLLYNIIKNQGCVISGFKKHVSQVVLCTVLIIICITEMVKVADDMDQMHEPLYANASIVGSGVKTATFFLALILLLVLRYRGFITSGVLFLFWLLLAVAGIIPFYTKIILKEYQTDVYKFVLFYVYYTVLLLQLLLSCFAEKRSDRRWNTNPEIQCSFLSSLTLSWISSLMFQGYRRPIMEERMFELNPRDQSKNVVWKFLAKWQDEVIKCRKRVKTVHRNIGYSNRTQEISERTPLLSESNPSIKLKEEKPKSSKSDSPHPSLLKVLLQTFGFELFTCQGWKLVSDVMLFCNPLILTALLDLIEHQDPTANDAWKGYLYSSTFFVVAILQSMFFQQVLWKSESLALRVKASVIAAIYRKALKQDKASRKESTAGEIVNLMSVDAEHILKVIEYIWSIWSCPLQIAVCLYLLYGIVGYSMFVGLGVLLFIFPINGCMTYKAQIYQKKEMELKDERIKMMNEILSGIKVLKLCAWEPSFQEKILAIRKIELDLIWKVSFINALSTFSWTVAPYMVSLATFGTYVYVSEAHFLDAKTAFVAVTLFNILRFAVNILPYIITDFVKAIVSVHRVNKYLNNEDLNQKNVDRNQYQGPSVIIKDGSFSWDRDIGICLKDIELEVPQGQLIAIVGAVGEGKSSLLSAMLGEIEKVAGYVGINGSTAYVPQQAWIQNETLQNNILFGERMKRNVYDKVIDACALLPDFQTIPSGDLTEIGEKGINLSGGQKQRISLARAVYFDADIYMLDDPLSAVDSHVGKHIFQKVIGNNGLLNKKTRILVTHGLQYLSEVDAIVVMKDGKITEKGTYDELLSHDGPFAQFLRTYLLGEADSDEDEDSDTDLINKAELLQRLESVTSVLSVTSDDGKSEEDFGSQKKFTDSHSSAPDVSGGKKRKKRNRTISRMESVVHGEIERPDKADEPYKLIEEEKVEFGSVRFSVFLSYAKSIGVIYFIFILILYGLYEASSVSANMWLSEWTSDETLINRTLPANSSVYRERNDFYFGIYGGLGLAQAIFVLSFSVMSIFQTIKAAGRLHAKMLAAVLRAPMSFFDTTPIGRIVNRFSQDMETVDNDLPMLFEMWLDSTYFVLATLFVISYTTPIFLAMILPLGFLYGLVQRFYISTSRQLKRIESKTRSPIYNHFSETLSGCDVIRAYGLQDKFIEESERRVDYNQLYRYTAFAANRWCGVRLESMGGLIVLAASLLAVYEHSEDSSQAGLIGLSISYALEMTGALNWMVRMTSELETNIVSVERITQFIATPPEAQWYIPHKKPPSDWPTNGSLEFLNYSTRYRPGLDLVLKGVDLSVKPGEKVGVVGRTGAGKSSMALSIFRIIEAAAGSVFIDGKDISDMGLHELRTKITVLPQDPVLFSGSIKMNLDPMGEIEEDSLWTALEHAHLKPAIEALPSTLQYNCGEGGQNLSVGQRQLLCLARSLLRKNKILVLDEATAAVDMETDELIQATIKREFSDCTVISIAHRLKTVMDYDKILVLDNGVIAEFDSPDSLLKKNDGVFYSMAKDAGIL